MSMNPLRSSGQAWRNVKFQSTVDQILKLVHVEWLHASDAIIQIMSSMNLR